MSEIRITVPSATCSKAEELATLQKLVDTFAGTQSYLSMLFTHELVDWFKCSIDNDWHTDLLSGYQKSINDNEAVREAWGEEAKDLKNQLKKLDQEDQKLLADQVAETETQRLQVKYFKEQSESLKIQISNLEEILKNHYDEMSEMHAEITAQAQQILVLKARLFDLLDK